MKTSLRILFSVCLLIFSAGDGATHPMGNFSINHYSALHVAEEGIQVRYILDFAEIPAFQERQHMDQNKDGLMSLEEQDQYLSEKVDSLADNLLLKIAGERQGLQVLSHTLSFPVGAGGLPTMRLDIHYEAKPDPALMHAGESTTLSYADQNYPQRAGWKEMTAKAGQGLSLLESVLPSTGSELTTYPDIENISPPQVLETHFSFQRGGGSETSAQAAGSGSPDISRGEASSRLPQRGDAFTRLISGTVPMGGTWLWALMTAFVLGAMHALSPGHGKTLVAAYLVGPQGTFWHALILGLTVTFSHTIGVFLLGFVTLSFSGTLLPEQIYPWLSRFSGLTILIIGITVFKQRWTALKYPHAHGHGHAHGHEHPHHPSHHHAPHQKHDDGTRAHFSLRKEGTLKSILGLGISGGVIPCPSALVVLLSAVAFHQVTFGLFLILAFSAGLAVTLVGVGLSVVYLGSKFKDSAHFSPLMRFLPPVSAAGMAMLGGLIAINGIG